jgi:hypothetical protein
VPSHQEDPRNASCTKYSSKDDDVDEYAGENCDTDFGEETGDAEEEAQDGGEESDGAKEEEDGNGAEAKRAKEPQKPTYMITQIAKSGKPLVPRRTQRSGVTC